ncbi:HTH-type transcriptional regulator DmlR [BD1-7 clade bacterium]|uniref:HTH-type transcriptional regulator DmlR n=1 Tax=BD1-7 clade bacterium TaxID=2029982 RepID=A0A5S9PKX0_9GAMM|nr:HTH-type transcriptional regulator DmlR [BD1-7 clade bacterium]
MRYSMEAYQRAAVYFMVGRRSVSIYFWLGYSYNLVQIGCKDWTMSDLTQIHTFIEVAENGSFSEASRQLSLPRSTVSARIKALEKRLNVRLFNRNTRKVSLTNEGQAYLQQCQQAIALLNSAEQQFSDAHDLSGSLRLTVPMAMPRNPLSGLLSAFAARYPDLAVEVIMTDVALDLVADNIDVAIRGRKPGDLDLIARKLGETAVFYYASPQFMQSNKGMRREALLAGHCIFDPKNLRSRSAQITTTNFEFAQTLAINHQGIVALPESLCREALNQGALVKIDVPEDLGVLPLYVVFSSRVHLAPRVRALIDFIVEYHLEHDIR